jgi:hypothetical protein
VASFTELGFEAEHLSGPGRTDVRAVSPLPAGCHYVVIADAKASAKGQVIPFDVVTLGEHRDQHGADFVIAVGERFMDKKTIERATTERVGLMSIELVCEILTNASRGLIGASEIRDIVSMPGLIPVDAVSNLTRSDQRRMKIAKSIVSALATEAAGHDAVTGGSLSASELYMLLRNHTDSPSMEDIQAVLEVLWGPFVRGVRKDKDKYAVIEHVRIIANRLKHLGSLMASIDVSEDV